MAPSTIFIGMDAMDSDIVAELAGQGRMPTFRRLMQQWPSVEPTSCLDDLPGAIWPELRSGIAGWRSGLFFHPARYRSEEGTTRPVSMDELDPEQDFWVQAAGSGARVLAVDIPQSPVSGDLPGSVQIIEWGVHDRLWSLRSEPRRVMEDIVARHGEPLAVMCDEIHDGSMASLLALRALLLDRIEHKRRWLGELLDSADWDLVVVGYGESHCVGHHAIHTHLPDHPWRPESAPHDAETMLADVYAALDRSVGEVLERAAPDTRVIVATSHGMGPYVGGYQLIPEVLSRMGLGSGRNRLLGAPTRWPQPVRHVAQRLVPGPLRSWRRRAAGHLATPLESPHTKVAELTNNRRGGVRVNLAGRDLNGTVGAAEAERILDEVTETMLELRDPATGRPLVEWARRSEEMFGPERHRDLPDLIVAFDPSSPIEAAESERVGYIDAPLPGKPRTGDHTETARWWLHGPGLDPESLATSEVRAIDLAPTVLATLGLEPATPVDGRPIAWAPARPSSD